MTRFRIGVGLLAVLLALCVGSQIAMGRIQKPIAGSVALAEQCADREDWQGAAQAIRAARSAWDKRHTLVAALADHQPLEDIECLFAMLEAYAGEEDKTEFRAACRDLNRKILAVQEAQAFTLGSIF